MVRDPKKCGAWLTSCLTPTWCGSHTWCVTPKNVPLRFHLGAWPLHSDSFSSTFYCSAWPLNSVSLPVVSCMPGCLPPRMELVRDPRFWGHITFEWGAWPWPDVAPKFIYWHGKTNQARTIVRARHCFYEGTPSCNSAYIPGNEFCVFFSFQPPFRASYNKKLSKQNMWIYLFFSIFSKTGLLFQIR